MRPHPIAGQRTPHDGNIPLAAQALFIYISFTQSEFLSSTINE